jgi:hypothetical protein
MAPAPVKVKVQARTRRALVNALKPIMWQRKGPPPKRDGPVFLAWDSKGLALGAILNSQSVNHQTESDLVDGVTNVVNDVHGA